MQFDNLNTVNQKIDSCLDSAKICLLKEQWCIPGLRYGQARDTSKMTPVSNIWLPDSEVLLISAGSFRTAQGAGLGCVSLGSRLELCNVQAIRIRDEILKPRTVMAFNLTCFLEEFGASFACQLTTIGVAPDLTVGK